MRMKSLSIFLVFLGMLPFEMAIGSYDNVSDTTNLNDQNQLERMNLRNAAAWDFNNDGILDIFITFGTEYSTTPAEYGNGVPGIFVGETQLGFDVPRFADTPDLNAWGSTQANTASGILFADFDNDGDLDLFIPSPIGHQLWEYRDGKYYEETSSVGLEQATDEKSTINAAWGDFDGDGFVDLVTVVATHQDVQSRDIAEPIVSEQIIWQNIPNPNNPTKRFFVDAEDELTVANFQSNAHVLGAHWVDFDNDHDVDLVFTQCKYVGLDDNKSVFWRNSGEGGIDGGYFLSHDSSVFTTPNVGYPSIISGKYMNRNANTTCVADFTNDGYLDILYENNKKYGSLRYDTSDGSFKVFATEEHPVAGYAEQTWDLISYDFNNDGVNDLLDSKFSVNNAQRPLLSTGQLDPPDFIPHLHLATELQKKQSQGLCVADFTNDGLSEIYISQDFYGDGLFFWDIPSSNNVIADRKWVGFELSAPHGICNRTAIGANLILEVPDWDDGHVQAQCVSGGQGRASQLDFRLRYGLGSYSGSVNAKAILPNKGIVTGGSTIYLKNVSTDQYWDFELDGIHTVQSSVQHDLVAGTVSLYVKWYTRVQTDAGSDQVNFHTDLVGAYYPPQAIYYGNTTTVGDRDIGYRHEILIEDLPCDVGKKLFFSLQNKSGDLLFGTDVYTGGKIQACGLSTDLIPSSP